MAGSIKSQKVTNPKLHVFNASQNVVVDENKIFDHPDKKNSPSLWKSNAPSKEYVSSCFFAFTCHLLFDNCFQLVNT